MSDSKIFTDMERSRDFFATVQLVKQTINCLSLHFGSQFLGFLHKNYKYWLHLIIVPHTAKYVAFFGYFCEYSNNNKRSK